VLYLKVFGLRPLLLLIKRYEEAEDEFLPLVQKRMFVYVHNNILLLLYVNLTIITIFYNMFRPVQVIFRFTVERNEALVLCI
jgi:hypothetical protein